MCVRNEFFTHLRSVESSILEYAKSLTCSSRKKIYTIDITIVPLFIFDPSPKNVSRPYGEIFVNREEQTVTGTLIFNPFQILADQYWLRTNAHVDPDRVGFTPEDFTVWQSAYII